MQHADSLAGPLAAPTGRSPRRMRRTLRAPHLGRATALGLIALALLGGGRASADTPVPADTRRIELSRQPDGRYARRLARAPIRAVGDHDVLIRVHAVSLQRGDFDDGEGEGFVDASGAPDRSHQIVGSDAAGEVVRVGRAVRTVRPGQKVVSQIFPGYVDHPAPANLMSRGLGVASDGVFADYVVLNEDAVVPFPTYLTYEEASTLPSSALTAWEALGIPGGWTRRGDTVLVEGTGGVSTFALQFAVALGARAIVTSSSDDKLAKARALGAVAGVNYRTTPAWSAAVKALTAGRGVDLALDIGGRSTLALSLDSLKETGTMAIVGGLGGYDGEISAMDLMAKRAVARGVFGGPRNAFVAMCAFMQAHRVHPVIDRVYPFEDFEAAARHLKSGNFVGKIVLAL